METVSKTTPNTEGLTKLEATQTNHSSTNQYNSFSSSGLSNETQLTSEEVEHLFSVMIRAKKFDEESLQNDFFEGQLSKYTNVVKGWQYRWFVINSGSGTLEYYMLEERKRVHPPRGCVYLAGCQIVPSEEDSQTFTVNPACGEIYKLKAVDAKNRQIWVNKLRLAAQNQEIKAHSPSISSSNASITKFSTNSPLPSDLHQSLDSVRDQLLLAQRNQAKLSDTIETITNTDQDLLLFKATAQASLIALEKCYYILETIRR